LRVALVWRDYKPTIGGGAIQLRYIMEGFDREGIDYELINYDNTWHIPIRYGFLVNLKLWSFFKAAARKLDKGGFDWCLCQALNGYAGILSKVVTITRHSGLVRGVYERVYKDVMPRRGILYFKPRLWMEEKIFKRSEGVICATPTMKREIELYFERKENVFVVGQAIDTSFFERDDVEKPKHPRILFVGREQRLDRKGTKYLFQAFELVKRECPEAELYTPTLKGWVPHEKMPEVYHRSTIFVYPSLYEGLANVVLEAMACKLPCVVTDIDGQGDIIRSGWNGLKVPPRDSKALAEAILKLIYDPGLAEKLGENAYRTVKEMTPERFVKNILAVAERLTGP